MARNESEKSRKGSIAERVAKRISNDVYTDLARCSALPGNSAAAATAHSASDSNRQSAVLDGEEMPSALPSDFGLADGASGSAAGPEIGRRRRPDAGFDTMISERAGKEPARFDLNLSRLSAEGYLTPNTPRKRMTEEYRLIKRALLNCHRNGARSCSNLILVTSALPNEGKTFTAINLALSMTAEEGISVLLIDADANRIGAAAMLGCHEKTGLIDVLENPDKSIVDVMLKTNIPNLNFLPAGRFHGRSTELLAGARMKQLAEELANRNPNRLVLFDCPPLLATTEAAALTAHVGQVLFVVRAEATKEAVVRDALELIDQKPEVGLVLNRTRLRFGSSEFGDYYTYCQTRGCPESL